MCAYVCLRVCGGIVSASMCECVLSVHERLLVSRLFVRRCCKHTFCALGSISAGFSTHG